MSIGDTVVWHDPTSGADRPAVIAVEAGGTASIIVISAPSNFVVENVHKGPKAGQFSPTKAEKSAAGSGKGKSAGAAGKSEEV